MFNMTLLYMNRNIPLQAKILFGYMMLMAVIISMAAILFHEHARLRKIEADTYEIRQARRDISEIHRNITVLASLGESVIAWEDEDYHAYQTRRLRVDSLLQNAAKRTISYIFGLSQIDTLQQLLADKETHLHQIMQVFHRQDKADSLLVNHLPEAARQATQTRTVVQKKKGIAGWFGGKENGASARLVRQAPLAERTAYRPASGADTQHGELHRQPAHPQQGTEPQTVRPAR